MMKVSLLEGLLSDNLSRKEKRKQLKKLRRKQIRQQVAEEEKSKENAALDDEAEQLRIQLEEQSEAERLAKAKEEHDEQERLWLKREKKAMEDFQRQQEELRKLEEDRKQQDPEEDGEYVDDDGPAEIIWKGNEIIVKKRRVKVLADPPAAARQGATQATSNPLLPQSSAFAAHNKYQQTPVVDQNTAFGTEQDKTHCPFHIKTGVCRFGVRCSRVHVYPDHSLTLLVRNMYTGPGLAWENDEGLENSVQHALEGRSMASAFGGWMKGNEHPVDEEVAQHYEEFYEDVHSEFLQFGELVNFKVCNNASSHLRGNLYVHYKTEASAQAAYVALNGRFYAGKQITCEFVGVTRWRVALCGEYMKGHHRLCSHGSACNFLHCFRNPHGEYDWADWDAPRPRSWVAKMAKMFGYKNVLEHEHDYEHHDDVRQRRRSRDSPSQIEFRHWEHRIRDRHHRSNRDDLENSGRYRGRKWSENGHDDIERSSRHRGRHRRRDIHEVLSLKELDERGMRTDRETNESESGVMDYDELKGDTGKHLQNRHKSGIGDVQGEGVDLYTHKGRRVSSRDTSMSSSRLLQDADDDRRYKRHRSRDYRDSDRRQSMDLRSGKGRSQTSERVSPTDQIQSKSVRSVDGSGSSENSDLEQSHRRHRRAHRRYSEGRNRRKESTPEHVIESKGVSPDINDRWTGDRES